MIPTSGQVASLNCMSKDFRYCLRSGEIPWARTTMTAFFWVFSSILSVDLLW